MATLTHNEAADAILGRFKTQWDADSGAVAGSVPPIVYDNIEPDAPLDAPWARVTVQHAPGTGGQSSLGETGNRLFDRFGVVTVSIFTQLGKGVTLGRALGTIAMDAFEGKTAGPAEEVWFKNVRMSEVGPAEDKWFQTNVTVEFQYDTLK